MFWLAHLPNGEPGAVNQPVPPQKRPDENRHRVFQAVEIRRQRLRMRIAFDNPAVGLTPPDTDNRSRPICDMQLQARCRSHCLDNDFDRTLIEETGATAEAACEGAKKTLVVNRHEGCSV